MLSIKSALSNQDYGILDEITAKLEGCQLSDDDDSSIKAINHTKNIFNYIIENDKTQEIIRFIESRKILIQNEVDQKDQYLFNDKKIAIYEKQAKENLTMIFRLPTIKNIEIEKILLSTESSIKKLLHFLQLLIHTNKNACFYNIDQVVELQLELSSIIKKPEIDHNAVIELFKSTVKKLKEEESLVLDIFHKTALSWGMSIEKNQDEFLDFLSLGICWLIKLTSSTTISRYELSCVFDSFVLLTIKKLGFNPWNILKLDDTNFNIFCQINKLLIPCSHIHYCKLPNWILNSFLLTNKSLIIYKYLCLFLAKIEPLLWNNTTIFQQKNKPNIEILPYDLLLATFNIFPEVIANSIFQQTAHNTQELKFNTDVCFFGEEFEFNHKYNKSYVSYSNLEDIFVDWKQQVLLDINQQGITSFSINYPYEEKHIYNIGDWSYSLFKDGNNLEINATPYLNTDQFTVVSNNINIKYSAYEMFDKFIHPTINKLNYTGVSGHKHFDARSLNGNTELLLRIIIDFENNSWFPAAIDRLNAEKSFFPYLKDNDFDTTIVTNLVLIANEKIKDENYTSKYGNFNDLVSFASLFGYLDLFSKNTPCNIQHLKEYNDTPDLQKSPKTTVELRMFNFPKNGHESYLINNLISARINYLLTLQVKKVPISYNPIAPYKYANNKIEVINKFNQYVTETGLNPEDYKEILHIT